MDQLPKDLLCQLKEAGAAIGKSPEDIEEEMLAWIKIDNYHKERDRRYQEWRSIQLAQFIKLGLEQGKTAKEVKDKFSSLETPEFIEKKKKELGPEYNPWE